MERRHRGGKSSKFVTDRHPEDKQIAYVESLFENRWAKRMEGCKIVSSYKEKASPVTEGEHAYYSFALTRNSQGSFRPLKGEAIHMKVCS